jgi:hypothetical protein
VTLRITKSCTPEADRAITYIPINLGDWVMAAVIRTEIAEMDTT